MRYLTGGLLSVLLAFCFGTISHAGEISGRVTAEGRGVEGAVVTFCQGGRILGSTCTDRKGGYSFRTGRERVDIVCEHQGFAGKIMAGVSAAGAVSRVPELTLSTLKAEVITAGVARSLMNEIEVYRASEHTMILIEKLKVFHREFKESYGEAINNRSRMRNFDIHVLLRKAAACNHLQVIELLIAQGMGINVKDREGNTPLHMAAERGNRELILLLLAMGADRFEMNNSGLMALEESVVKSVPPEERLFRIREGYAGPVSALCFSPGGRFLVSGGKDGRLRIWNPMSGKLMADLIRHKGAISAISFSPGGTWCASGSEDGTVILWDWSADRISGRELRHSSPVRALCFSREGKYLLIGCDDGSIHVWNVISGKPVISRLLHEKGVTSVCLSPDTKYIITAGMDGTVKSTGFRDLRTTEILYRHVAGITTISLSESGRTILSGDENGIMLFDALRPGQTVKQFPEHEGRVACTLFSPGGSYMVSSGSDGTIKFRSSGAMEKSFTFYRGTIGIGPVKFSPGGSYLAAGCDDGSIILINTITGTLCATMVGFNNGEWISLTPRLYFDCSLNGAQYILLDSSDALITLDQYWALRRNSKQVRGTIDGTLPLKRGGTLPLPPRLMILSPPDGTVAREDRVPLKVKVMGGGAPGELLVLINGRPAGNGLICDFDQGRGGVEAQEVPVMVRLQPGLNRIEVIAISTEGVRSSPGRIEVHCLSPGPVTSKRLFLLSVGINEYGDRKLDLDYAVSDARAVENFFAAMKGLLFEEVKSTLLVDSAADNQSITNTLQRISRDSTDNDCVILFLAGHGIRNEKDEFFFLCPGGKMHDTSSHVLNWKDFQKVLHGLRAKQVLLLIDACHSGSLLAQGDEFISNDNLAEGMLGVTVYASCRGSEPSCEIPRLGGVFTQVLLSGLKGRALPGDRRDGTVTLFQVEHYVTGLVPRITENKQHPMILGKERAVDIPLSLIKGTQ